MGRPRRVAATDPQEVGGRPASRRCIQTASLDGYEMRQRALRPVYVGNLKVQMIAEYRGVGTDRPRRCGLRIAAGKPSR